MPSLVFHVNNEHSFRYLTEVQQFRRKVEEGFHNVVCDTWGLGDDHVYSSWVRVTPGRNFPALAVEVRFSIGIDPVKPHGREYAEEDSAQLKRMLDEYMATCRYLAGIMSDNWLTPLMDAQYTQFDRTSEPMYLIPMTGMLE